MILVWFGEDKEMPLLERISCLFSFALSSILISLSFSKTLFNTTITNRKTLPFILKFISLTVCLLVTYYLLSITFHFLETKGIFNSVRFADQDAFSITSMLENLPGLIAGNLLFCGVLLYYEYSELRNINLKYQLQILHSQINPHFMFNVLNHIYVLMEKDVNMASTLLLKYSDTLRYQLYAGKEDLVCIDKEIKYLKDYIDVEKFRWEGKLQVTCSWNIENGNKKIAPLLLITFIENAFKHVSRSPSQKGFINIIFVQEGKIVTMEVENSKSNESKSKMKSPGIGLENVKTRLDILYTDHYNLDIKETDSVYSLKLIINL